MNTSDRIGELLFKYLRDEISPEETLELEIWKTSSLANEKLFAELTDPENLRRELKEMYDSKEAVWKKILEKAPELGETKHAGPKWINIALAVAAVLVLLLIIGFAWVKLSSHTPPEIAKKTIPVNDVLPGTNKAILILAGGSRIVLDSAANGQIAGQGNATVIKKDSGSLVYNLGQSAGSPVAQVWNTLETPRGGQFQLTLQDGTKVWLNAASSLVYPVAFTAKERVVMLSGEAYFEVAKDALKPFKVKVNDRSLVEVLGTHFNIMGYKDENVVATTLLEGKVKVQADSIGQSTFINPGQQALVNSSGAVQVKNDVDTGGVVSWKNGTTSFAGADIKSIMRKVARWYDVDVSYTGDIPAKSLMGGIPRQANLSEVLSVLSAYDVKVTLEGKKIIISPK